MAAELPPDVKDISETTGTGAAAGIYIHVPFCSAICPYCDFAVQVGNAAKRRRYVATLCDEIQRSGASWNTLVTKLPAARIFDTIYFGGGTPSFLEPEELDRILETLRAHLPVAKGACTFLEANPEDVTSSKLTSWKDLGVATLSLGIQSFDDDALTFLGRRHRSKDAWHSVETALGVGFSTVSVDLIYGLPGQSRASWQETLNRVCDLEPDHLSCYELEIHRRTSFGKQVAKGTLHPMPDEAQAELFVATHQWLEARGFKAYELSNFARSESHQSLHNRKYWNHTPYLGLGPSAHSFAGRERWWNNPSFSTWQRHLNEQTSYEAGREDLGDEDLLLERIMLALRTRDGIDLEELRERYGCDLLRLNEERIKRYIRSGLLCRVDNHLRPTLKGWIVADALAAELSIEVR